MDEQEKRAQLQKLFDTVARGYDNPSLRFFHDSASVLADLLDLQGNERVLDVATGTGAVALELAPRLPDGNVTAIDLSAGMLDRAREKLEVQGCQNAALHQMDMTCLELPDDHFDAITGALDRIDIRGVGGQRLRDKWADAPRK